jgi:hypothetical protein
MPKNKFFESWLKDVGHNSDIIMRRAGDEGTQVHNAIEELLEGKEVSWMDDYGNARYNELVWGMIIKFKQFWALAKPELIFTEEFTYSDTHKYAGTADIVVKINGETWLIDFKTSNHLQTTYDLQGAVYAKCYEECFEKKIDRVGILWLKSSSRGEDKSGDKIKGKNWEIHESVRSQEENLDIFKSVHKIFSLENPKHKPASESFVTSAKRNA